MNYAITFDDIVAARKRITAHIQPLRVTRSDSLSNRSGSEIVLAHEYLQTTGAFKLRGAMNAVLQLPSNASGVTAVSTGNHGRALAYSAQQAGVPCTICMEEGFTMIPPFDHPHVIAGQGTLGLEMLQQVPDLDTVLVQLSGGGLISGIALALKAQHPEVRIIGISMERGAAMAASQAAGKPLEVEELPTLADSLGGGIGLDNHHTFAMVRDLVDEIILLDEDEIAEGIRHAYFNEQVIIEGGGAVGIAALLANKIKPGAKTVVLLSGKNIDMQLHRKIINQET